MKISLDLDLKNTSNNMPASVSSSEDYQYPDFTVTFKEGEDQNLDELPEEGTMVIRYRRKKTVEDNSHEECSYTFCVEEIISAEGEEDESPSKSYDSASDALDKLAEEKMKSKESY